jgi:FkbM family methyltransferase
VRALAKSIRDRVGPPVYGHVRRLWSPPPAIYRHLPYFGEFAVEVEPGATFRMRASGEAVENALYWSGYAHDWEKASLAAWRDRARKARLIVDVGANSGVYALAARAVNGSARIVAFEPSPRVMARLKANIALNGFAIDAREIALSDRDGTATFYDFDGVHQYSASLDPQMGGTIETKVQTRRLDDVIDGPVDLIKIDVEMHEPAVLRGMTRILARDRPVILIEVLTDAIKAEIESLTRDCGYRWTRMADDEAWTNYLLVPEAH